MTLIFSFKLRDETVFKIVYKNDSIYKMQANKNKNLVTHSLKGEICPLPSTP